MMEGEKITFKPLSESKKILKPLSLSEKLFKKESNYIIVSMNKSDLNKSSKSELIKLLLAKDQQKSVAKPRIKSKKPTPAPCKGVKQMVKEYEENIILPPIEFRDNYKPVAKPRTKKPETFLLLLQEHK